MEHEAEYHDAMITMLELIWGAGFMVPGGEGNVAKLAEGLDLRGKRVLDIGSGLGGPAFLLARKYGAHVVGTDIDARLVECAQRRAEEFGLSAATEFILVEPGPLTFSDESFDFVASSGAFTQIENKKEMFGECLRVLKPGGFVTCYEWMKSEGDYSEDMLHWFKLEGLTYAMATREQYEEALREAGFVDVEVRDRSEWYRDCVQEEYEKMKTELYPRMVELMGKKDAGHFLKNWRAMVVVCVKGEMRQGYCRARKPASRSRDRKPAARALTSPGRRARRVAGTLAKLRGETNPSAGARSRPQLREDP
jgi:phosphoethanolamine N-methyltransferase